MSNEPKLTIKQWEDYVVTTSLILGWEETRWGRSQGDARGPRWRRAMHWLETTKGMTILISGEVVEFIGKSQLAKK